LSGETTGKQPEISFQEIKSYRNVQVIAARDCWKFGAAIRGDHIMEVGHLDEKLALK